MSQNDVQATSFEEVNDRLKQIVEAVSDEELPLDEALDLFDEAVALGMKASEMMEDDIAARDAEEQEREARQAAADEAADAELNAPAYVPAWARSSMAQQAQAAEAPAGDDAHEAAAAQGDAGEEPTAEGDVSPEDAHSQGEDGQSGVELDAESELEGDNA